jgi:hypothetical protein
MGPKGSPTPRRTGRLTVGRKINSTQCIHGRNASYGNSVKLEELDVALCADVEYPVGGFYPFIPFGALYQLSCDMSAALYGIRAPDASSALCDICPD